MHVDLCLWGTPRQRADDPGMIQVHVRDQDMCEILWIEASHAQPIKQRFQCARGAGIDERKLTVPGQEIGADNFLFVLEWQ
jgi:hypothetical protein